MHEFSGKFALVTGGGRGIGFAYIKELLLNGIEGVTLVDIDSELGSKSKEELNKEFGEKVIFVQADVSKADQVETAFQVSLNHWKYLDIVINNAGVLDESNVDFCLSVNCGGTYRGVSLGFKYMSKSDGGRGGVILNTSSVTGIDPHYAGPIYSASKSFIISLGRAMGTPEYFDYSGIKILTLCPGLTATEFLNINLLKFITIPSIKERLKEERKNLVIQSPEHVAKAMITVLLNGNNGSVWVIEKNELLHEVEFPSRVEIVKGS